jgi:hypothetical protein
VNVRELVALLSKIDPDREVRIGDQIESGPYSHTSVGGVWRIDAGIVMCASPDDEWVSESTDEAPPIVWTPPP